MPPDFLSIAKRALSDTDWVPDGELQRVAAAETVAWSIRNAGGHHRDATRAIVALGLADDGVEADELLD